MSLTIKESKESRKFKESHFEFFNKHFKIMTGKNPLDFVSLIFEKLAERPDYVYSGLDDYPYQMAAVDMFNDRVRQVGLGPFTLEEILKQSPLVVSEYRSCLNMLHHLHRFSKSKMIFHMEEGITAKLAHTDIAKVDSDFLASPYDSMFISIPHNKDIFVPNPNTGLHLVKGFYVSYINNLDPHNLDISGDEGLDDDGIHPFLKHDGVPANKAIRIMAIADKNENSDHDLDDATYYMSFFFSPGDVFPQVKKTLDRYSPGQTEDYKEHAFRMFSFVLNCLLYINNPGADLLSIKAKYYDDPRNPKKSSRRNNGVSKLGVVSVGSSIKISSEFRRKYREGSAHSFTIQTSKWMVKGHWRHQAYGEGRKLRKLLWIEPYSKGQGVSNEALGRDYVVTK